MANDILKIIDECLARIARGESSEQCLSDYPEKRQELEPLLKTALVLLSVPRVSPSDQFPRTSQA